MVANIKQSNKQCFDYQVHAKIVDKAVIAKVGLQGRQVFFNKRTTLLIESYHTMPFSD